MSNDSYYRETILDHYRHPRNFGRLENPDISYEATNPLCGDKVGIDIKVADGLIEEIGFYGKGCAISQASASMLMELSEGKPLDLVKRIGKDAILAELGIEISPARLKCALLPLKVLHAGLYGSTYVPGEDEH